ncbi:MAG: glycosyltransferase family 92 protein [Paludibacteraceae bacterium]|nr:glycosyltransferase family 92 protein [Paludibacteraceae bacterium]
MKTLICCIVKQENLYLRDFIEYYKNLGVNNILLYDNNDENGEYPQQVIGDYIANGFVIYEDVRGKYRYQLPAYTECYEKYKTVYDWIGFFDVDEYLEILDGRNVNEFLSDERFNDSDAVFVYWLIFGDSGHLHYENKPVYERFVQYKEPDAYSNTFKVFLRCNPNLYVNFFDANMFSWTLTENRDFVITDTMGVRIRGGYEYQDFCYEGALLKHYNTLSIEEFLYRRFGRRSYADRNSNFNKETVMNIFYTINEMTPEKEKIINDFFNKFEFEDDLLK